MEKIKLQPFSESDYWSYSGVESDDPQIASFVIEGRDADLVVEENMVGVYLMDSDEAIATQFIREFGRNDSDEFFNDLNIGLKFAEWFINELCETTTLWELTDRFGFIEV
jgi:hypothetical protein